VIRHASEIVDFSKHKPNALVLVIGVKLWQGQAAGLKVAKSLLFKNAHTETPGIWVL
jgi:hypothetical protein